MKASTALLCLSLGLALTTTLVRCGTVFASPENWSEVIRFSGPGGRETRNTTSFRVDHAEWRIRWSYTPKPEYADYAGLIVYTYRQGETNPVPANAVNFFFEFGSTQTNGTSYTHNKTGIFYMTISAPDADLDYTLVVQQDLDSVPEFPFSTLLPLIFTSTLILAILHKSKTTPKTN